MGVASRELCPEKKISLLSFSTVCTTHTVRPWVGLGGEEEEEEEEGDDEANERGRRLFAPPPPPPPPLPLLWSEPNPHRNGLQIRGV